MRAAAAIGAAVMVPVVVAALLLQIEVTDGASSATRSCGSVFDSAADRSGWELWWASDLDEAAEVRSALPRTTLCPDAVNRRVAVAAGLAVVALALGGVARWSNHRRVDENTAPTGHRIGRIGRVAGGVGGALTALGVIAIVVLVADGDSTMFLYVDRLVVAIVGLIVLVPTMALVVLARVLVVAGEQVQRWERGHPDD